jgi:predicted dehydrogenase
VASGPRLRVGVVGAGLIGQVEHVPNLVHLRDRFELVGVADPSAAARGAVAERYGTRAYEGLDPLHAETVLQALDAGLHVFCEKPLCLTDAGYETIASARDRAGRIVQVGYMKRFDPNYEAALRELPADGSALRYVTVEVHDPDAWPYVAHRPLVRADDLPAGLGDVLLSRLAEQAADALGRGAGEAAVTGWAFTLMSGLVHCVNAVHGMLDRLGVPEGEAVAGEIWSSGEGGGGAVRLLDGQALLRFAQVLVPRLALYRERYALWFDDRIVELEFPAPYLNHHQTRLTVISSDGLRLERRTIAAGFEEAFVRELEGFHDAVTGAAEPRNTVEEARRDARLLTAVARLALAGAA